MNGGRMALLRSFYYRCPALVTVKRQRKVQDMVWTNGAHAYDNYYRILPEGKVVSAATDLSKCAYL